MTFTEYLKVVLTKLTAILMMSAKLANVDLLEIKVFLHKGYDVKNSTHDINGKILSRE